MVSSAINEDVALNTYWGLYALQHRGQESTGIVVTDGEAHEIKKGMGLVADVFKDGVADLQGYAAIGHVRYSTTGASMPYNIQPLKVYFDGGNLALSHNGNLTNAGQLRANLAKEGAVFNTTVDSEVVLTLIAYSARPTIEERVAEAVNQIKGAFAILLMLIIKLSLYATPTASVRWYSVRWKTAGALLPNPVPLTWLVQSWYAMLSPAK